MTNLRILLLAVALIFVTGCSSIRGERVDTGFGSSVEPVSQSEASANLLGAEAPTARLASELSSPQEDITAPDPISLGEGDATASFDFRARELYSGSMVDGTDLFGQGQVLVTFVRPGCDITIDGGSTIAEVAEAHPEAIFVIVHDGADDEAYKEFAEQAMLFQENMVHLSDTHGSIAKRYSIDAYPTTLLIDADLRITSVTGAMDLESQRAAVDTVTTRTAAE